MTTLTSPTVLASVGDIAIFPQDVLRLLRERGQLVGLITEIAATEVTVQAARHAGYAPTDEELQQATNRFRYQHGLRGVEDTHRWLEGRLLSVIDFEAMIERNWLIERWKDHLFTTDGESFFRSEAWRYERIHFMHLTATHEGMVREWWNRIHDEGVDFRELVQHNSANAGDAGILGRWQLSVDLAETLFAAECGATIGPIAMEQGYHLYHIVDRQAAEFDEATRTIVREHVFERWLAAQLSAIYIQRQGWDDGTGD